MAPCCCDFATLRRPAELYLRRASRIPSSPTQTHRSRSSVTASAAHARPRACWLRTRVSLTGSCQDGRREPASLSPFALPSPIFAPWLPRRSPDFRKRRKRRGMRKSPGKKERHLKTARGTSMGGKGTARERAAAGLMPVAGRRHDVGAGRGLPCNAQARAGEAAVAGAAVRRGPRNCRPAASPRRSRRCRSSSRPGPVRDKPWVPHRPPRPEKSEGGIRFKLVSDYDADGRPADRHRRARRGPRSGDERDQVLLGVTGSGKTFTMAQGHRGDAAPGADPRAQQDARRPALRRDEELLPRQRGRVFRLLLRLLPARSLRPAHRHLYREGILDQRADRPHAPLGDARAPRARRRHHRRLGLLHLRHRLGRDLHGHDLRAHGRRAHRPAPSCSPTSSRCNTSATTPISSAAPSACAATPSSSSRRTTRTAPGASRCSATRSSRSPSSIRSPARSRTSSTTVKVYANSHYVTPRADARPGDQGHQGGAAAPASTSFNARRQAARSPAPRAAHAASTSR